MSEYTPSTETIRIRYAGGYANFDNGLEDFDRWLATHDTEVRAEAYKEEL